jgi:hypothetical protein
MAIVRAKSDWDLAQIEGFFDASVIPIRLAVLSPAGKPLVCALWFVYSDGALWCATKASAAVAKYLIKNPECGFEVACEAMPYKGVRGQGHVSLLQEEGVPVLLRLIDRYLGTRESGFAQWLIANATDEVAIRIEPEWLTAWDFTERMQA